MYLNGLLIWSIYYSGMAVDTHVDRIIEVLGDDDDRRAYYYVS